jgi:hypothetical protein
MDSLLAGTQFLPWEVSLCRYDVQRRLPCGNHSGLIAKAIPGLSEKLFAFPPELLFAFSPESVSSSARNAFHVHPGIPFAFARNPHGHLMDPIRSHTEPA